MKAFLGILLLCLAPFLAGADELFQWQTDVQGNRLSLTLRTAPQAYVHAESVRIACLGAGDSLPEPLEIPTPSERVSGGETHKVYGPGLHRWLFRGEPPFRLQVAWQGCRGDLCLMPQEQTLLPAPETPLARMETRRDLAFLDGVSVTGTLSGLRTEREFLAFLLKRPALPGSSGPSWDNLGSGMLVLLILLGGFGLNLTPCVLPMIPVNLAIIGAGESRRAGLLRGTAYGCGMALACGTLGSAAVLTGARFGVLNSSWIFNFCVALLFFLLAAATAGWFFLDLSRWRVSVSRLHGGKTLIAFLFGGLSALLAGACVAPVVLSVLLFAAQRYQAGHRAALLLPFLLGLGMALPWPFAGAGLAILPKPGKFMIAVKYLFAALICGAGIHYALLGWDLLPGRHDPRKELLRLEDALKCGKAAKRPVLVILHASWCQNCRSMENRVLNAPEVRAALQKFITVRIRAERPGEEPMRGLFTRWSLPGLPAFVILDP